MDPELKELLEKAKAAIGDQKKLGETIEEIKAWGAEKGRLSEAEKAIRQVNDQVKVMTDSFEKKLAAVSRQVYDGAGRYQGRCFATEDQARTFGLSVLRHLGEHRQRATEMLEADHKEFIERVGDAHGGEQSLVAHEHSTRIDRLVEDYGHARRLVRVMPVSEATGTWHRRTTGLRARKTKVRTQVTEQTAAWEPLNWTIDDYDILVSYPITLSEDMLVPFAEMLAQEMALGFAIAEDEDLFIGDGSADYDNIVGFTSRLTGINGVDDGGGLILASGNAWSEITESDVDKMIGQARFVRPGMGKFTCSNEFFWQVLARIMGNKGGVTLREVEGGVRYQYKGITVGIVPVMPRVEGSSHVPLLYGDFGLAATLFTKKDFSIRESREVRFESKEVVMLATERIDMSVHTVGDADTAGPVVGLVTAAA